MRVRPVDGTQRRQVPRQPVARLAAGVLGDQREHVRGAGAEADDAGGVAAAVADVLDVAVLVAPVQRGVLRAGHELRARSPCFGSSSPSAAAGAADPDAGCADRGAAGPGPYAWIPTASIRDAVARWWRALAGTGRCRSSRLRSSMPPLPARVGTGRSRSRRRPRSAPGTPARTPAPSVSLTRSIACTAPRSMRSHWVPGRRAGPAGAGVAVDRAPGDVRRARAWTRRAPAGSGRAARRSAASAVTETTSGTHSTTAVHRTERDRRRLGSPPVHARAASCRGRLRFREIRIDRQHDPAHHQQAAQAAQDAGRSRTRRGAGTAPPRSPDRPTPLLAAQACTGTTRARTRRSPPRPRRDHHFTQ